MITDRWQQLERIFDECQVLMPGERAGYLDRVCGADESLKTDALSLLAAAEASREFMAGPALDQLARSWAREGWSLRSGDTIGSYTILRLLGAGGAGEVWRARDERLDRDVAIKVLLPHFATDHERLRRFGDEARTAGALNHSNILTVYDVGEHHGIPYIVSECLEGQSLRQRMNAGALRAEEAIAATLAVARGLAAAHARGIIHRDLKPENVFIRTDGSLKILDFGLAKLQPSLGSQHTQTAQTLTGMIVGTAGYMAPEQINGATADARSDLFALGVMLYEMVAGRHPFKGVSVFETLHSVLNAAPEDLSTTDCCSAQLARVVMRSIRKAPDERFQSALDFIWALEQAEGAGRIAITSRPAKRDASWWRSPAILAVAAASALTLLAIWTLLPARSKDPFPLELTRFTWRLPADMGLASAPVVSPDSRYVAFVAVNGKASTRALYVRDRSSEALRMIPGSEEAQHPFWSADSQTLGFFRQGGLLKVAWPGGSPVRVADAALFPFGGTWSPSGTIIFAPDVIMAGLHRVGAGGERAEQATVLDMSLGDTSHSWPVALPDGRHFLYFVRSARDERRGIYVGRLDTPASPANAMLMRTDSNAVYVPFGTSEGVLLYVANGRLESRRFDSATLRLIGDARTIDDVSPSATTLTQAAMLSASPDMLIFATTTVPYGNRIEAVDRSGQRLRLWNEPEAQNWPRLSPDGRHLARQRVDPLRNTPDVWVEDLERGAKLRVTTALEPDIRPVWSPDGRFLAYVSGNLPFRRGTRLLSIAAADGTGVVRTLPCPGEYCEPTDWTPRGLVVNVVTGSQQDVWLVPTEAGGQAHALLADTFPERDARIAHNGQWISYVSEESGRPEVSVRSISGPKQRLVISSEGGDHPVWRRDGTELFFVDPQGQLTSVSVRWSRGSVPTFGLPVKLNVPPIGRGHWGTPYDVSPDGSRIYCLRRNDDDPPREIHVVMGWRRLIN